MTEIFFQLIQVALGRRTALERTLTAAEWNELYQMVKKQVLVGIGFVGMQRLPSEQWPDRSLVLKWNKAAQKLEDKNNDLNKRCEALCRRFQQDDFWVCVLKGQSNLPYYPEQLRAMRNPGDIDLWVRNGKGLDVRSVIEYCDAIRPGQHKIYYHMEFPIFLDVETEVHYRPTYLNSPFRNRVLHRWFEEQAKEQVNNIQSIGKNKFPVPTLEFNVVYQLLHIYRHLFLEGIGLRQLIDYHFVLQAYEQSSLSASKRAELWQLICRLGMKKFAGAVMWALQKVCHTDEKYLLCPARQKGGEFLLSEIMVAGNFGHYDTRFGAKAPEGTLKHSVQKQLHNMLFLTSYPEEVVFEPCYRFFHWAWRTFRLWRYGIGYAGT